jgi:hypothetical protein
MARASQEMDFQRFLLSNRRAVQKTGRFAPSVRSRTPGFIARLPK